MEGRRRNGKVRDEKGDTKERRKRRREKEGRELLASIQITASSSPPFWFEYCCMSLELPINSC